MSHTSAGGDQSSPKLRRIYCLGYARFIFLSEFHAHVNHHSCYGKTLVPGTPWMSCGCTPTSLITRAAMSLMKFSKRLLPILMVRPSPSFACYIPLTSPPRQLPRRPSRMCTFQDRLPPPSYSRQFTIFTTPTVVIITSSVGSTTEEFGPAIVIHKNTDSGHFSLCFSFTLIGLFNDPPSYIPSPALVHTAIQSVKRRCSLDSPLQCPSLPVTEIL